MDNEEYSEYISSDQPKFLITIPFNLDGYDSLIIFFFLFFAVFSRFWVLPFPRVMTKIEGKYIKYLHNYRNKTYFHPEEPVLAKIAYIPFLKLMEYDYSYPISSPNDYIYQSTLYNSMRSIPAFCSTLAVPIGYLIMRLFRFSKVVAFSAAFFMLCECSLIGSARFIGEGGLSQLFNSLTLMFIAISYHYASDTIPFLFYVIISIILSGICLSIDLGSFPFYVITMMWSITHLKNMKLFLKFSVALPLIIYKFSLITHVLLSHKHSNTESDIDNIVKRVLINENPKFGFNHILYGISIILKQLSHYVFSISISPPGVFFDRLLLKGKAHIEYSNDGRFSINCTNFFITVPSFFIICYLIVFKVRRSSYDFFLWIALIYMLSILCFALGLSHKTLMGVSPLTYLTCIVYPIALDTLFSRYFSSIIISMSCFLALLFYYDISPFIYFYDNPYSLIPSSLYL